MSTIFYLLPSLHLLGLAFGIGAATVKMRLIFMCKSDLTFIPTFLKVTKPITLFIIIGQSLLTLTGIVWLFFGYPITTLIIFKIILVLLLWVLGPYIDNALAPKFAALAPKAGETPSPEFVVIQKKHFAVEMLATVIFYVIMIMGTLL